MKVLIVDDHTLIREALHAVLKQLKREAVIFEASNSRQAMHIVGNIPTSASFCSISICLIEMASLSSANCETAMRPLLSSFVLG